MLEVILDYDNEVYALIGIVITLNLINIVFRWYEWI